MKRLTEQMIPRRLANTEGIDEAAPVVRMVFGQIDGRKTIGEISEEFGLDLDMLGRILF